MLLPPARNPLLDPPIIAFERMGVRKPWLQALAVFVLATFLAWVGRSWPPGPWNLVWMAGLPVLIALIANRGVVRLLFWLPLIFVSFASLLANEIAAHLLFATCLGN
jgi:hypothetical protein